MDRFYVGIDPAADQFTAALVEAPALLMRARRRFDEFETFCHWLKRQAIEKQEALVCVENTGVYSEKLLYALFSKGFRVVLLDPYKIWKAFADEPKTDEIDSRRIAEYGFRYRDKLHLWQPNEVVAEQVKVLLSTREQLVGQKTAALNTRGALKRKAIQTPAAIRALEQTIATLKQQIQALEEEIERLVRRHPNTAQVVSLLVSAPGVSLLMSAHLLVLTNAFTQVARYRPLAQYLGICPNRHESGKSVRRRPRARGYGPNLMRKLLHLAPRSVTTHNERFRGYYLRKLEEGKPKALVPGNVSNKLLKMLCGMIRNRQPYIEGYRSVNPMLAA